MMEPIELEGGIVFEVRCGYVHCRKVIKHPKPGQKFCPGSACRSAQWHLENDPHCPECGARLKLQLVAEVGRASVESAGAGASA